VRPALLPKLRQLERPGPRTDPARRVRDRPRARRRRTAVQRRGLPPNGDRAGSAAHASAAATRRRRGRHAPGRALHRRQRLAAAAARYEPGAVALLDPFASSERVSRR